MHQPLGQLHVRLDIILSSHQNQKYFEKSCFFSLMLSLIITEYTLQKVIKETKENLHSIIRNYHRLPFYLIILMFIIVHKRFEDR